MPPLRDRKEDIPLLFSHFLGKSNERNGKKIQITSELLDFLISYPWPGNIREMQNLVERMVILAEGDRLDPERSAAQSVSERNELSCRRTAWRTIRLQQWSVSPRSPKSLHDIERLEIEASLRRNGWVQVRAARELGLTERQIGYRIKKYGLNRYDSFR